MPFLREAQGGRWIRPRAGRDVLKSGKRPCKGVSYAVSSDCMLRDVPEKTLWKHSDEDTEREFDIDNTSQLREVSSSGDSYDRRPSRLVVESCKFIWSSQQVASALRSLPYGETLWCLFEAGVMPEEGIEQERELVPEEKVMDAIDDAVQKGHGNTALLISAWHARPNLIHRLLKHHRIGACAADGDGRTPLHLACCAGDEECVTLLLSSGGRADAWDNARRATPVHCAACSGSSGCLGLLLASGGDVNIGIDNGKTALYYAVQVNSLECVKLLLKAGSNPNTPQVYTETPLHVAATCGFSECVRLLLEGGADVRVQFGPTRATALHLAAQDGNADCATLLLDAGADTEAENYRLQTPLHLAALTQSTETLELLIRRGAFLDAADVDKRTPLHCAIVKESRSSECVRLLLMRGANVNCSDAFGYTPLHLAALHEFSSCVGLLINSGADVMARTKGGVSALTFIVRRTPDTLPCFVERLDSSVTLHDHDIGDADCEIKVDFRALLPSVSPVANSSDCSFERRGESAMLLGFVEVGMRHLLKHPLCEIFLFLKWRRIRKFFLISLAFHLVFVALCTTYIVGVFSRPPGENPGNGSLMLKGMNSTENAGRISEPVSPDIEDAFQLVGYVLLGFNIVFMLKEIFQLAHGFVKYANHWENWLQWLIILSVFASHGLGHTSVSDIATYQHHIAALGIVFTWTDLMVLIGRFPTFGVYVQMFTTVSINFSKFLLAYCCLLIGFGLGLGVLFPEYPSFNLPHLSLLKSVIMMSGELEYEDIFFSDKHKLLYKGTSHVMFLAFVILVTVILTNLLVGLAVSDIQGLQKTARLNRLVRQAELVAHLESIMFSRLLLKIVPLGFIKPCLRKALLVSSAPYNRTIHLRPNDPRENRVPRYLLEAAYDLVASRSGRKKKYPTRDPGSKRAAYKSWTTQCSFGSYRRAISISEQQDTDDTEVLIEQGQVLEFISSQINALVADSESKESVLEDIQKKILSLEKSLALMCPIEAKKHGS